MEALQVASAGSTDSWSHGVHTGIVCSGSWHDGRVTLILNFHRFFKRCSRRLFIHSSMIEIDVDVVYVGIMVHVHIDVHVHIHLLLRCK